MEKQTEYGKPDRKLCQRVRVAIMGGLAAWGDGAGGGLDSSDIAEYVRSCEAAGLLDCLGKRCGSYDRCQGGGMTYNEFVRKYFPNTVAVKDKTHVPGLIGK